MDDSILEQRIRETLEKKAQDVHVDALTSQRIQTKVEQRIKEAEHMKHRGWKKVAIVAAAICVLGSITAVAVGKPSYTSSHSSHNEEVKDFATAKAMQNGYDASVKTVESFSNGYTFQYAMPEYKQTHDENHNAMESETMMNFSYKKQGKKDVSFSATRLGTSSEIADQIMTLDNGVELRYRKLANKFVPPDYQITEAEEKLIEEGKLNVGYGSDKVELINSLHVSWVQDGVLYSLYTFEDSLSADEMLGMAKEVAESE